MKMKAHVLAAFLSVFSLSANAFDLGKFLEKKAKREPATDQQVQTAAPQPAKQKIDPTQLGFALFGDYSLEEEVRIGRQIAGNLLGAVPLVRDDALQRYVNLVGRWVAQQSGRNEVTWRFGVIDTEAINAFAAPGGYVFVTKGLYRMLDNEAELAGVLGHEIAHVTKKHHLKVLKQSTLISALGQAASRKVQGSDPAVQNLIGNGAEIMARGLDKNAEYEADRVGIVFAARAGYDPWGLPNVLQGLAGLPSGDNRTSLLYKTHPHPADRLAELGEAVGDRFDGLHGKDVANRFYRLR